MTFTKLLTVYAAAGVIALVAWILNVGQLYWMAGTLVLLPQASRLFGLLEHRGLDVSRVIPGAGHQGETLTVRFSARNRVPWPKLHLSLADELPAGLEPVDPEPAPIHLAPLGEDHVEYQVRLRRRGVHAIPAIRIVSADMLGLAVLESRVARPSEIVVYPRVVDLPARAMPPEPGGGQSPLEASSRKGEGASFFGIREYRPGDPLRHVHWRSAARWGHLAVVEWEDESSIDAVLAVETRRGTPLALDWGSSLDLAAGLAASLASRVLGAGDSVRLLAPGAAEWRRTPQRGIEAFPGLLQALARMEDTQDENLATSIKRVAGVLTAGTLICWLTPSPDVELVSTACFLRAANFRPIIYALIDVPAGSPSGWDPVVAELESVGVPVVRLYRDDELVRRLLA